MVWILDELSQINSQALNNINRATRRTKYKQRVRNSSIDTCHPKHRTARLNDMNIRKELSIMKWMCNWYKKELGNIWEDKWLWFFRKWFK